MAGAGVDDATLGVVVDLLAAVQAIIQLLQNVEGSLSVLADDQAPPPPHRGHLRLVPPQ